jgi:tRNA-dihydrouridine synthase
MADVTDPAWRALVAKLSKPDVTFTEFVSADGLYHLNDGELPSEHGPRKSGFGERFAMLHLASLSSTRHSSAPVRSLPRNPLMRDLQFTEAERPIVAQFFTAKPEMMAYAAELAHGLGFDGVDINMGCPDRTIEHQEAGAALMLSPELARALIDAAKRASPLPVSVKTRIGFNAEALGEWLPALLEAKPAAVTLHLRTRKEMSAVGAHWELMHEAVKLRDRLAPEVLLIGNGDVEDLDDARKKVAETGCDGVMIGRGMFGNPWVFAGKKPKDSSLTEKLAALVELAHAFEALSPPKSFNILKKHIKAFVTGFDGARELRTKLMEAEDATELARAIVDNEFAPDAARG